MYVYGDSKFLQLSHNVDRLSGVPNDCFHNPIRLASSGVYY